MVTFYSCNSSRHKSVRINKLHTDVTSDEFSGKTFLPYLRHSPDSLQQLGKERRHNKYDNAGHEHGDGLLRTAFPLFQYYSPYIAEGYVEGHQYAP